MIEIDNSKLSYRAATLQVLTNMSEGDLQSRIVEPLLRLSGFENVRDNSGPGEKGKDLVAVKYEFTKPKLYSIQIKKIKLTGKAFGTNSLNNVVSQLRQTMLEPVIDSLSNTYRIPDRGIFITPFQINREAFESAIKQVAELERREITLIDGPVLVDLVPKLMPDALPEIGREIIYKMQLAKTIDNIPESTAFGLKEDLSLDNIYVDVDVLVGMAARVTSTAKSKKIPLIDAEIQSIQRFYKTWMKQEPPLKIKEISTIEVSKRREELKEEDVKKKYILLREYILKEQTEKDRETDEIIKLMSKRTEQDIKIVDINLFSITQTVQNYFSKYSQELKSITKIPINKAKLSQKISEGINFSKDFLSILNFPIFNTYWPHINQPSSIISAEKTVSIPAKIIMDIDYPIFITGEPGSGKTTLLRRIAQNISRSSKDKLAILVYLVRLQEASEEALIQQCITELNTLGYDINIDDVQGFLEMIDTGKYKLLLDGLDETGTLSSGLFKTIRDVSTKHPNCPIVVTCRNTSMLNFWPDAFYLSLRPFSDSQMEQYIVNWFNAQPSLSKSLMSWLNNNVHVKEIARTPVMTAVLCSLYGVETDIPTTIAGLYESRFDLLLGKWEKAKNIEPLSSKTRERYIHFLTTLAFYMHTKEISYISVDEIIEYYHLNYIEDVNARNVDKIRNEGKLMIYECIHRGLLIRENKNNVSFGHLTNQEFLAAKHLDKENPLQFIFKNLDKPWWQRTIQYYAMIQKDITRFLKTYLHDREKMSYDTWEFLKTLTEAAPLTNRKVLAQWRYIPKY